MSQWMTSHRANDMLRSFQLFPDKGMRFVPSDDVIEHTALILEQAALDEDHKTKIRNTLLAGMTTSRIDAVRCILFGQAVNSDAHTNVTRYMMYVSALREAMLVAGVDVASMEWNQPHSSGASGIVTYEDSRVVDLE